MSLLHCAVRSVWFVLVGMALSGCAGSGPLSDGPPSSLRAVNDALRGERARITTTDSTVRVPVYDVFIGPDSTTYRMAGGGPAGEPKEHTLVTSSLAQVSVHSSSGGTRGMIIGAVPGATIALLGAANRPAEQTTESGVGYGLAQGYSNGAVVLGVVMAFVGGAVGYMIDDAGSDDRWVPVYRGPVEAYTSRSPKPLSPSSL